MFNFNINRNTCLTRTEESSFHGSETGSMKVHSDSVRRAPLWNRFFIYTEERVTQTQEVIRFWGSRCGFQGTRSALWRRDAGKLTFQCCWTLWLFLMYCLTCTIVRFTIPPDSLVYIYKGRWIQQILASLLFALCESTNKSPFFILVVVCFMESPLSWRGRFTGPTVEPTSKLLVQCLCLVHITN